MTRTATRLFFVTMLALAPALTVTERSVTAQRLDAGDWAADRSPIAVIALYNGSYEPGDRWGLQECWRQGSSLALDRCGGQGGVAWLVGELERRRRLGYHRFMLSLPAGRDSDLEPGQGWPSAQWHLLDSAGIETLPGSTSVRRDLAKLLTAWLREHRDVQLLIYQGLRFDPKPTRPWTDRNMAGSIAPNLKVAFHRKVVQENTVHWLELTPRDSLLPTAWPWTTRPQIGFMFDNTGVESTREALVAVLEDQALFGAGVQVFVGGEAIPHAQSPALPPPEAYMNQAYILRAPWFGLMRFHQTLDPHGAWYAPPGAHLGFAVHNREYCWSDRSGTCTLDEELTDQQIHDAVRFAHERGFLILHYGGAHDSFIAELTGITP